MSSSIGAISNNLHMQLLPLIDRMNFVYSPLSLTLALLLVYLGSAGQTRVQMQNILGIKVQDSHLLDAIRQFMTSTTANIGNAFIIRQKFVILPTYAKQINVLKSQIIPFNNASEAVNRSNLWVSLQTKGLIPKLLTPSNISSSTNLIIINTIYFKGQWIYSFDKYNTQDATFTTFEHAQITLPLMNKTMYIPYYETARYQLIELPYRDQPFVMGILLSKDPLFLSHFLSNPNMVAIGQLPLSSHDVDVFLPKFTHKQRLQPMNLFQTLGIVDLFDLSKCNLSLITRQQSLYVGDVIHEAVVKVNEEGTEAAAATAMIMPESALMPSEKRVIQFKADHTFYYYIKPTNNNIIYFSGIFNG